MTENEITTLYMLGFVAVYFLAVSIIIAIKPPKKATDKDIFIYD